MLLRIRVNSNIIKKNLSNVKYLHCTGPSNKDPEKDQYSKKANIVPVI